MKSYIIDEETSERFLSLDLACETFGLSKAQLKDMIRNRDMQGSDRFKYIDGAWYVSVNFERPLALEVEGLYYEAIEISKSDIRLAKALASYEGASDRDVDRLYAYLHRFSFKHYARAKEVIALLKRYLHEHGGKGGDDG